MNRLFTFIILILLIYSDPHGQHMPNKKAEGLEGPAHSIRIEGFEFSPVDGAFLDKPFRTQVVVFDRQGNTLERTLYKSNGSIEHQVYYTYDLLGRMINWKEYYGEGVGSLPTGYTKHAIFTYDKRGLLSEVTVFQGESIVHKSIHTYDAKGNKIQESNSGPDAYTLSRTYKYDSAGKLLEESLTSLSVSRKVEREYDETGNVVEERIFENGSLKSSTLNTYDKGKLVKAITLKPDGAESSAITNRYNDAGGMIESA